MNTCMILPTRGRVGRARGVISRMLETARGLYIRVVTPDEELLDLESAWVSVTLSQEADTSIKAYNLGLSLSPDYDVYIVGADDLEAQDRWYENLLPFLDPSRALLVGINDGIQNPSSYPTHFAVTRRFITDLNGGVLVCPHYWSWYADIEIWNRAVRAGAYSFANDSYLLHRHVNYTGAAKDETARRAERHQLNDSNIFEDRKLRGFPDDFQRILPNRKDHDE